MKTNQKRTLFYWLSIICFLIFSQISYGQMEPVTLAFNDYDLSSTPYYSLTSNYSEPFLSRNYEDRIPTYKMDDYETDASITIEKLTYQNVDTTKVKIKFTKPDASKSTSETVKVGQTFPSGTFFEIPSETIVKLISANENSIILDPGSKHRITITDNSENHRTFFGKAKHFIKKKVSRLFSYRSDGGNNRYQAAAKGTEFSISVDTNDVAFERFSGEVAINSHFKIELNEELTVNSGQMRELYESETTFLSPDAPTVQFISDSISTKSYKTEEEIDLFFKKQLKKQKSNLTRKGPISRSAFRNIMRGKDSLGIAQFEEAITNGEIERDDIIQSALLLSEAYFKHDNTKNKEGWLETALYFNAIEYQYNQEQYDRFTMLGELEAMKGYGNDFAVSTQYYAWAYTVKLKLNACLETKGENPEIWRRKAETLNDKLNKL